MCREIVFFLLVVLSSIEITCLYVCERMREKLLEAVWPNGFPLRLPHPRGVPWRSTCETANMEQNLVVLPEHYK